MMPDGDQPIIARQRPTPPASTSSRESTGEIPTPLPGEPTPLSRQHARKALAATAGAAAQDESRHEGKSSARRPKVVAFDVIDTLFTVEPLRPRLQKAGLPAESLELWYARLLRDAAALDATGVFRPFPEVARATLEVLLAEHDLQPDREQVEQVLAGLAELDAYPDVQAAFEQLRDERVRVLALTNGSAETTWKLLQRARLEGLVERVISIDEAKHWKPRWEVYLHAAKVAGVARGQLALVAAHAWDVQGAGRAGLVTGWVARREKLFHPLMEPADVRGETITDVVRGLLELPVGKTGRR